MVEWPLCSNVTLLLFLSWLLNYNLCDTKIENHTPTCCIQRAFVISVLCTCQVSQCFFYCSVTIVYAFHISLALLLQVGNTTSVDSYTLHPQAQDSEKENLLIGWLCVCVRVCVSHGRESFPTRGHYFLQSVMLAVTLKHDTYSVCTGSSPHSQSASLLSLLLVRPLIFTSSLCVCAQCCMRACVCVFV